MRGYIEKLEISPSFVVVHGWACSVDGSRLGESISVALDGGETVRAALSFREDLRNANIGEGYSAFAVVCPRTKARPARIALMAPGQKDLVVSLEDTMAEALVPAGAIDSIGPEGLQGWLCDPETQAGLRESRLLIGNSNLKITPEFDRPDLPFVGLPGMEKCLGFRCRTEDILPLVQTHAFKDVTKPLEITLKSGETPVWRYFLKITGGESYGEAVPLAKKPAIPPMKGTTPSPKDPPVRKAPSTKLEPVTEIPKAASPAVGAPKAAPASTPKPAPPLPNAEPAPVVPAVDVPPVLVVSWDMGHNPLGRAYLLADIVAEFAPVTLTGAHFERFGKEVWGPLRGQRKIPTTTFDGGPDLATFLSNVVNEVEKSPPVPTVYVSKARLPSVLYGFLMKLKYGSTVVIDVDDHELSFFKDAPPLELDEALELARQDRALAQLPFDGLWTRVTELLVKLGDAVTVSNIALQERFGGAIIRHARNEKVFNISPERRRELRAEFGLTDEDIVVLFIGTPRPHKGIFEIADALEEIDDPRLVYVIIGGINDKSVANGFNKYKKARILRFGDQPFERLHELASIGDIAPVLQRSESAIADYQIPAKLTDALALGIPVAATEVGPLADLHAVGAFLRVGATTSLADHLRRRLANPRAFAPVLAKATALYRREFTYAANATRLQDVFAQAQEHAGMRSRAGVQAVVRKIFEFAGVAAPSYIVPPTPGNQSQPSSVSNATYLRRGPRDLVFFWKQNDTDLYGRRSDMMLKYLIESGRVRRVLHIDRPRKLSELTETIDYGPYAKFHEGNLLFTGTIDRMLKMRDTTRIARRTFVHRDGNVPQTFFGRELPPASGYLDFVKDEIKALGIEDSPMAWVCPVVFDFPMIHQSIGFDPVIVDIIDDQRSWKASESYAKRIAQSYVDTLELGDLVLANCKPVQQGFGDLRPDIHVVPNGAEDFPSDRIFPLPEDLAELPRPWIGYVGNLRDRIDSGLIREMARRHPDWSIVLIGSARGAMDIMALDKVPNIHLLGVRAYERALNYIKHFDVAIMPHLHNEISGNMNPLKLYVYFALGKPIVTSAVANIDDIAPIATVADDSESFIAAVERTVAGGGKTLKPAARAKLMNSVSWRARVEDAMKFLEQA